MREFGRPASAYGELRVNPAPARSGCCRRAAIRWLTVGLVGHTGRLVGVDGGALAVQCPQPAGGGQVGPDLDFGTCQAARGGR